MLMNTNYTNIRIISKIRILASLPRKQLFHFIDHVLDWHADFYKIFGSTELLGFFNVAVLGEICKHDNGDFIQIRIERNSFKKLEAGNTRHDEVENNKIRLVFFEPLPCFFSVKCLHDAEPVLFEAGLDKRRKEAVVFNN